MLRMVAGAIICAVVAVLGVCDFSPRGGTVCAVNLRLYVLNRDARISV